MCFCAQLHCYSIRWRRYMRSSRTSSVCECFVRETTTTMSGGAFHLLPKHKSTFTRGCGMNCMQSQERYLESEIHPIPRTLEPNPSPCSHTCGCYLVRSKMVDNSTYNGSIENDFVFAWLKAENYEWVVSMFR